MKSKGKAEVNINQQDILCWEGPKPLIVNGRLRVVINDIIYLPELIKSIPIEGDKVWIVFKMGKDCFQSVGHDCIVNG